MLALIGQPVPQPHDQGKIRVFTLGCGQGVGKRLLIRPFCLVSISLPAGRILSGDLTKQFAEPWVDLCSGCSERFADWLKSGRQTHHDEPGGAISPTAVAFSDGPGLSERLRDV